MTPLLLVRLGADDRGTLYAVIDRVRLVTMFTAANDDEALAKARAHAPEREVVCEAALAAVAQRRRAATTELTRGQLALKVHLAAPRFLPEMYGKLLDDRALVDFFDTVAAFMTAVADDVRDAWSIGATVRGTIATTRFDLDVLLLVLPGADPGLHVISRADADASSGATVNTLAVDHMVVELCDHPRALVELTKPAYGLEMFPQIELVEHGKPRPFDEIALELAAAYLFTVVQRATLTVARATWRPRIGGELEIVLQTYDRPAH